MYLAVGDKLEVKAVIGRTEELVAIQWAETFTLKIATAVFAEMLESLHDPKRRIPKRQSYTLNSGRENLRIKELP
jgi:hypothetical protein